MSSNFRERWVTPLWIGLLCLMSLILTGTWSDSARSHALSASPTAGAADDGLGVPGVLRVAAEPNNLPFSNDKGEGFENKLAELIAREMGVKQQYVWRAHRRGFVRETLKAGEADLIIGVPSGLDMTLNTAPYYRSAYAFVYRKKEGPAISNFDDPRLKTVRIGVPLTFDSNPPPIQALAARGIIDNVTGFSVFGDYAKPHPTAGVLEAVAKREVDVAVAWGPSAGYFADKFDMPLVVVPIETAPSPDRPAEHFAFSMSMGVKHGNKALQSKLDDILKRRASEIADILQQYHVPLLPIEDGRSAKKSAPSGKPCNCG